MQTRHRSRLILGGLAVAAIALVVMATLTGSPRPPVRSTVQSPLFAPAVSPQVVDYPAPSPATTLAHGGTPTLAAAVTLGAPSPDQDSAAGASDTTPVYGFRVVAAYPHDPFAFTQGLQWVDGELFEGTGLYGRSSLRRVDLETGEVVQQIDLDAEFFGEGIVVVGDRIFQLTWRENTGFIYDRATFAHIGQFTYATEGWGLTYDGEHLLMSDGSAVIYRLDLETQAVVDSFVVRDGTTPVVRLNELEMVGDELFANIWQTDRIARINPQTGQVTGWIDLSGLLAQSPIVPTGPVDVLNGIAYDAATGRLWVTGKLWPVLFEIEIVEPSHGVRIWTPWLQAAADCPLV